MGSSGKKMTLRRERCSHGHFRVRLVAPAPVAGYFRFPPLRKHSLVDAPCWTGGEALIFHAVARIQSTTLRLHCVDEPSELCSVDISEQNLNVVKPEDLKEFKNVAYVNAFINSLPLGPFGSFVSLRELNLSLNGLCNLTFRAADFPHLQVLDLSYNILSADDILLIGQLPCLKILHLTGNQLHHLPPDLNMSLQDPTQWTTTEEDSQFAALEVLVLDDNKLSSGVFKSLANLKRLKHLNLQGNCISEVPYLNLMDSLKLWQTSIEEQAKAEERGSTEPNLHTDEYVKRISSSLLLPQLQTLNLADNQIAEEESLMAVAFFPKLREIDIRFNPLTTRRSGDPPLLTHYLQKKLGITIKRKKTQEAGKSSLKAAERVPKVSKKSHLINAPRSAQAEKCDSPEEPEDSGDSSLKENPDNFFITQVGCESDLQADEENKDDNICDKFPRYQTLMDDKPNPDMVKPIGIQAAVRRLELALKNLNVSRHYKAKRDGIQTTYKDREKKIKEVSPQKPTKELSERAEEMIHAITASSAIRDVPLSSAIHSAGAKQEALCLFKDMKTKYKMVHQKTMEQAANMASERSSAEM
ncbi:uncharacterized protein V6R79_004375 [Siganus canaliculatus]